MFTGIIKHQGEITTKGDSSLVIKSALASKLSKGDSISVNGICLSVATKYNDRFAVDFMPQTAEKTTVKSLKVGDSVNLELPSTPSTMLSGHIVQGHVDTTAQLTMSQAKGNSHVLTFVIDEEYSKFLVEQASICIDGVSLTLSNVSRNKFQVSVIPVTWESTNLKKLLAGNYVNIEIDVLAKYVANFTGDKDE